MTREEAKAFLTDISYDLGTMRMEYLSCNDGEKMREAIKALEQEPFINKPCVSEKVCEHDKQMVLDEIRAEIEDIAFDWQEIDGEHESFMVVDLNDALNIIDKYKAESEG